MGGLKKQQSIKINFDTLPEREPTRCSVGNPTDFRTAGRRKRGQGAGSLQGTGAAPRPSESPGKVCCAHLHTGYLYDAWKCATITVREQQPGGSGA